MTPATILEHDGIKQPITEWALDYGITPSIIIGRLERGSNTADAITKPMHVGHHSQRLPIYSHEKLRAGPQPAQRKRPQKHTVGDMSLTLGEWAAHLGITYAALCQRIHSRGSVEAAVLGVQPRPRKRPGVVSDLPERAGTGAGRTLQETPNITFSGIEA